MRTGRLGEKKSHWVTLVSERRLDSDENIAELLSVDNKVLSIRVQVSRGRSPVLFQVSGVRSEFIVLVRAHSVCHIQLGRGNSCLGIVQDCFHDGFLGVWSVSDIISFRFQLLQNSLNRVEDIKVCGSSNVTLIWWEREDSDGNFLVLLLLSAKVGPLQSTISEKVDTVSQGNTSSGGTFTSSIDNGLNGTVNLRKRNLKCNLDGVESKLRRLPFFEGLEYKWNSAHVRNVQVFEDLGGLLVIL
mmetsp:Transcript_5420/g.10969  ORF Transcript_5420/g.10969 Transcript_5420/m.10969 type:complete len:244 (+) Transcript_5420:726-1457(+)